VLAGSSKVLAVICTVLAGSTNVLAQAPRIANATLETRQLTRPLDVEIAALAAQGGSRWVGYRVPTVAGPRRMCGGIVLLEPPSEMLVLVRLEDTAIVRLRTVTPDCSVDAGGMPVVWLENVRVDDSLRWLTTLARTTDAARTTNAGPTFRSGVEQSAISTLALHPGQTAVTTLIALARDDTRPRIRSHALFWLAQRAGEQATAAIGSAIDNDPELDVKKRAVFALSQLPRAEGVPLLIQVARTHRSAEVRRQAMFWLGQSHDPRALQFFEEVLTR
jgi:hypothetical protein